MDNLPENMALLIMSLYIAVSIDTLPSNMTLQLGHNIIKVQPIQSIKGKHLNNNNLLTTFKSLQTMEQIGFFKVSSNHYFQHVK